MPKQQLGAMMGEYGAFTEGIRKSGQYIGGEPLQPTQTATTVRVRQGKISTTDGPFADTKEQLGGFYLINATDLNEAIQVPLAFPRRGPDRLRFGRSWCSTHVRRAGRQTHPDKEKTRIDTTKRLVSFEALSLPIYLAASKRSGSTRTTI